VWCILLYIIIHILLYYILSYTILFSYQFLSSSSSPSHTDLSSFLFYTPLFLPNPLILSFILYLSVLTYTYLYSINLLPISNNNSDPAQIIGGMSRVVDGYWYLVLVYVLTPHVLSEWMVEVCRFYLCGVRFCFRAGV
jgi:hypothetical protein